MNALITPLRQRKTFKRWVDWRFWAEYMFWWILIIILFALGLYENIRWCI